MTEHNLSLPHLGMLTTGGIETSSEPARLSPKAAALATARALKLDPTVGTEYLDGVSQFDPDRDAADAEDVVRTKTERYAITAAAIDVAASDFVTNPSDARNARFILPLPDTSDNEVFEKLNEQGWGGEEADNIVLKFNNDISAAIFPVAREFLNKHPEFSRAAERYKTITSRSVEHVLNGEFATLEQSIGNVADTLGGYVAVEFVPLMQRLLYAAKSNPDLATPEQRLDAAKDAAQRMVFGVAAVNLGHFAKINNSDTKWRSFIVGDSLEGELVKTTTGKWDIRLLPGSERPLKPKKDLAGDTISCPAMLQLEANDSASPLHRMVYATINEAAERGLFSDEGLQTNMDRIEAERLEALRMREEFVKWHNGKRARDDMVFQGTSFEMSRDYVQQ